MKTLYFLLTILFLSFAPAPECGDGNVYANATQTQNDNRFADYTKIDGIPEYKGGEKKLDKLILAQLKLSDVAKTQIFNLNFQFTVTCDGKIKDVKQIGDPKANDWTNIVEIIQGTEGSWTPAKKDGQPVDCIYFDKVFINGSKY
jgi:hypothetical protein